MKIKPQKLINEIKKEIKNVFPEDVMYAIIFGSRAREEYLEKSDVDLMIIFKEDFNFHDKLILFKRKFIKIQLKYNLDVDYDYPGEYVSIEKVRKSLAGYGFVKKDQSLVLCNINKNDWTNFNEYRQWLCALATPNILIHGDEKSYEKLKKEALQTIVKLFFINQITPISYETIIKKLLIGGKEYLGFCNTKKTQEHLESNLPSILEFLMRVGILKKEGDNYFSTSKKRIFRDMCEIIENDTFLLRTKFVGSTLSNEDRKNFLDSVNLGLDFITEDKKVINYYPENEIKKRFLDNIPKTGKPVHEIIDEFREKILDGAIHQSSPNYLAFPDSGNSISALVGSILENFINQNLIATTKSAPTATFLEMQVIQWLRKLIGFTVSDIIPKNSLELGGLMTAGGTLANTTALLVARSKAFPDSRKSGVDVSKIKPILIVASDTLNHYSHIAAFWWIGLGEENIVFVKSTDKFKMDPIDLESKIIQNNNGITSKVVAVIVLAGDSRTTTIEDFTKISKITKKHKVWLHIDACHGGVLIFSKSFKQKIKGIQNADSVSIDPHKGLGIPYSSSAVLFKNIKDVNLISKSTDITIQNGSSDLGQITSFLGSKPFDSLKLWFLIKNLGLEGISSLVDYRFKLAVAWSSHINQSNFFESLNDPDLNSVVFSLSPKKILDIFPEFKLDENLASNLNKKIHDMVYKQGKICIHSFDIFDHGEKVFFKNVKIRVLGVTIGNPHTSVSNFPEQIRYLDEIAKKIIREI